MTEINITEMSRNFSDYLNRVSYLGEQFTILKGKKPIAQITPIPKGRTLGELVQILNSSAFLTPDEALAFEKDLNDIRDEGNQEMLEDPWASS
jgi:antitoxin (DNA-binding transcriptional repressor) of toxin-antitoxin stability system